MPPRSPPRSSAPPSATPSTSPGCAGVRLDPARLRRLRRRPAPAALARRGGLRADPHLAADDPSGARRRGDDAARRRARASSCGPVERHDDGLPVAQDLQDVHRVLEESFQDHFSSYRESFPEFVMRLREDPGHRWDHWWLATVETDEGVIPAGALVSLGAARGRRRVRGQLRRLHRGAPTRPWPRCREGVVAHRDRGCRAAGAQPGRPRGGRRLTHGCGRPLHLDGLGHRLPHAVLAPRARPGASRAQPE